MWYERTLVAYLSYDQTFGGPLPSITEKYRKKNIEMNFTDAKGVDLSYYDALYSSKSTRNLPSFKDIRRNGYHIETMNDGNKECLYITSIVYGKDLLLRHSRLSPLDCIIQL